MIITDERIQHIKDNHPGDYDVVERFLKQIVEEPDYILEDAEKNTGLLLKTIIQEDLRIKVVIRIHTSEDSNDFKNSIISAWRIREKEFNRLLRNKRILYKNE